MKNKQVKKSRPRGSKLRPRYLQLRIKVWPSLGYEVVAEKPYKTRGARTK